MEENTESQETPAQVSPLAENIRKLRHSMGFTQKQLADLAGIPRATLATMESASGNPAFQSVIQVAKALGVSLNDLIQTTLTTQVTKVRREDMQIIKMDDSRYLNTVLTPINSGSTQINEISMLPGCEVKGKPHPKGSDEFFFVNEGEAIVEVNGEQVTVEKGDLIYFPGNQPHRYMNKGNKPVHAFSMITHTDRKKK